MHKTAHCPNHNRQRMRSQPAIRCGLPVLTKNRACYWPDIQTVIYLELLHLLHQFFGLSQNLCTRSHCRIIIVNICAELWLTIIRDPGRQVIQLHRDVLADVHIRRITAFQRGGTRALFQPASCSNILAKSEALLTRTQPELNARISFWNRPWFGCHADRWHPSSAC